MRGLPFDTTRLHIRLCTAAKTCANKDGANTKVACGSRFLPKPGSTPCTTCADDGTECCAPCTEIGCDDKCKVPGPNRGPCCDKPGCELKTVDFDTSALVDSPDRVNNLGGYGPQKDDNDQLTIDGGSLAREMRLPASGSFVDTDGLNGVKDAVIVFDSVLYSVAESASGRKVGAYKPKKAEANGIYRNPKFDIGNKADIVQVNFGQCCCCCVCSNGVWCKVG